MSVRDRINTSVSALVSFLILRRLRSGHGGVVARLSGEITRVAEVRNPP